MVKKKKEDENMIEETKLFYVIETVKLLVENEKTLLKRIQKLEAQLDKLARAIIDDGGDYKLGNSDEEDDEDRIIN